MSKLRIAAALCAVGWIAPSGASAVCRVVMPVAESGREPVVFDPTTMAVFVMAPDQVIDYACPPRPGTDPLAAAEPPPLPNPLPRAPAPFADPATDPDAGLFDPDAGATVPIADAGAPDAGFDPSRCWDGSTGTPVLGSLVHAVVQPSIYANGGEAGLIMPVPSRADVHVGPPELLRTVASLQRARVDETVTWIEDPSLGYQCSDPHYGMLDDALGAPMALYGCGDMEAGGDYYRPGLDRYETDSEHNEGGVVEIERIPATEDYEVAMVNASSLAALTAWLDDNGFAHSEVDDAAFSAYVQEGAWFMAVKVTPQALGGQHVALAPLVVTWVGQTVPVMNRLQFQPGGGHVITDAFVMAPRRATVGDRDGETLYAAPADFGSQHLLRGFGLGAGWLTRIVLTRDTNVRKDDTVIVQTHSTAEVRPLVTREVSVRIAAPCCPGGSLPDRDGVQRRFTENRTYLEGELADDDYFRSTPAPDAAYCPGGGSYDEPSYGYYCDAGRTDRRLAALASWLPLLGVIAGMLWRRRRLRRRARR